MEVIEDSGSALDVSLHPLTIINISDHYTREKVGKNQIDARVFGALIGVQKGRKVEIFNSFAFLLKLKDNTYAIDDEYLATKIEQFKKVFEDYEVLGWYATGVKIFPYDPEVHVQLMKFNENPPIYYLILNLHKILENYLLPS